MLPTKRYREGRFCRREGGRFRWVFSGIRKRYDNVNTCIVSVFGALFYLAITTENKRLIEKFFSKSLWYGFTGTPIFAENKRAQKGDLARTTQELYGECLHKYTIKEAIHDGAVLGFQIQSMGHNIDQFRTWAVKMGLYAKDSVMDVEDETLEREVLSAYKKGKKKDFYDSDEHRNKVIDYIVNRSDAKLRLNAGDGRSYEGLLTVASIEDAQRYYRLVGGQPF